MVGRGCTVCGHERRREIDTLLVGRMSYRDITRQFPGVSKDALSRHARAHLPVELTRAAEARRDEEADEQLGEVRRLQTEAFTILDGAKAGGDLKAALAAIRELRYLLELKLNVQSFGELEARVRELQEMIEGGRRAA